MSKIMSYSEYRDSDASADSATLKMEGEDLVFSYRGKNEKLSLPELKKCNEDDFALRIKEAVTKLGASRVSDFDKLEEFISVGTDGGGSKKGFFANALNKLFRKERSHKTVWEVILGDAEDEGNRIRN